MKPEQELWQRLLTAGLVEGELAEPEHPWYMQAFFTFMAWFAAQSLVGSWLAFLGLYMLLSDSFPAQLTAVGGGLMVGVAAWASWRYRSFFITQLVAATAIAGTGLLSSYLLLTDALTVERLALLQIPLFVLVRNGLVRSLAVLTGVVAGAYALGLQFADSPLLVLVLPMLLLATAMLYASEVRWARWLEWTVPLKRGLTLALWAWLILQQTELLGLGTGQLWVHHPLWLTLSGAAIAGAVLHALPDMRSKFCGGLLAGLALLAGWWVPGVTALSVLLALAWRQGQIRYALAHAVALLLALVFYYYNLEQSLLIKSVLLMGLAILLVGIRLVMLRLLAGVATAAAGEKGHA